VALGTALARPLLGRLLWRGASRPPLSGRLVAAGLAGVALDLLLKAWLAPFWRRAVLWAAGGLP
jgi:hypothetical protein